MAPGASSPQSAAGMAAALEAHLLAVSNRALERGALVVLGVTVLGVCSIAVMMFAGTVTGQLSELIFTAIGGLTSLALYLLARRRLLRGATAYAFFFAFVSAPTLFLLLNHCAAAGGAAESFFGPQSYVYPILIIVSGFLFDFRLSVFAGVVAGVGYFGVYLLVRPSLGAVHATDAGVLQVLTLPDVYVARALFMVFAGLAVGALALVARRLTLRALAEERDKAAVSRLFGQYVSEEVKQKLLADPAASQGERKRVSILFCDIRGFTTISEGSPPEEIVRRLNAYFDEMVAAIAGHGGTIDKFIGDAIMAVFGGILALENPAAAAVEAAGEMRRRLAALNRAWRGQGLEPFENGIGIHVGEVVQGAVGSEARKDFTVIGDAVNTASRLEGLTKGRDEHILVSAALLADLPDALRRAFVPLGSQKVKGRAAELEVYGLADGAAAATPAEAAPPAGRAPGPPGPPAPRST